MTIYLRRTLLRGLSGLPESHSAAGRRCFLFGLASDGVYRAIQVTLDAGELLPHRFTLTGRQFPASRRFNFCGTDP